MNFLLHSPLLQQAKNTPDAIALEFKDEKISYANLADLTAKFANGYHQLGLEKGSRVGVFLPKLIETVTAFFGTLRAGGSIVPVNPILKAPQIKHILCDCDVSILVTSTARLKQVDALLDECQHLQQIVLVDFQLFKPEDFTTKKPIVAWSDFCQESNDKNKDVDLIESDLAAIFYTSGSTGKPKGVVLTHHNMLVGAHSVAQYQNNHPQDRILATLPFSFDYGFSQLTTAMVSSATVVLLDYLLPKDVIKALEKYQITGLAGVPPLWMQLTKLNWPESIQSTLRYITNSGGAMPQTTLGILRERLPTTDIYLMYGLTEAFRSTYLPPSEVAQRPTSMGKAIPNAEIFVINNQGELCKPGEVGELVHRGPLVAQGYWNDPEKTAQRYKPLPSSLCDGRTVGELAVWSGDSVTIDEDGYLYFVSRTDEMIKTSGYRVSPTEIEETTLQLDCVTEVVALGVPHPELSQAIAIVITSNSQQDNLEKTVATELSKFLPNYMVPKLIKVWDQIPRNANGKFDRKQIYLDLADTFQSEVA